MDETRLIDKFKEIENHFIDTERQISDPEMMGDQKKYQSLVKSHKKLKEGVELFRQFMKTKEALTDTESLLKDAELKQMAEEEAANLKKNLDRNM